MSNGTITALRRAADLLLLVALALLPLHRPLVHDAPHISGADLLAGVALALYLSVERLPRAAWLRAAVLALTLLPSVLVAADQRHAAVQLAGLVYVMLLSGAAMSLAARRPRAGLAAIVAGATVACLLGLCFWDRYPWMALPRPIGLEESPSMLSMVALGGLFALRVADRSLERIPGRSRILQLLFWTVLVVAQSRILLCAVVGVAVEAWPRRRALASVVIAGALVLFAASLGGA